MFTKMAKLRPFNDEVVDTREPYEIEVIGDPKAPVKHEE
jgi:hypothetical protein